MPTLYLMLFVAVWLTADSLPTVHEAAGYAIAALLAVDLLRWTVAKLRARWRSDRPGQGFGTGPLFPVLAAAILAAVFTGWFLGRGVPPASGPVEEFHEALSFVILALAILHLAGSVRIGSRRDAPVLLFGRREPVKQ